MTASDLPKGLESRLGGYRVEGVLGRGGMGVVYRAGDVALGRSVALKLIAPELAADDRFRERFLRESRLAASLDHPAIVPIYEAGEVAGLLYIAMRLVDGTDMKRLLAESGGALPPERALHLLEQVADALDAAHERGLVHRDVKPSNVLVDKRGHCYLADFGLSRQLGENAATSGPHSLGTVDYVAPEQIRGDDLDGRSDLYSLGCVLYECLAGRPPFTRATETAVVFAHLEEEPPSIPATPALSPVIKKALAKEPDDRYQSGIELIDAARSALGLAKPRRLRSPFVLVAAAAGLIAVALFAAYLQSRPDAVAVEAGADSLIRIDPATNRLVSAQPVGREASGVAASGRYVWVTSYADGTVRRLEPTTDTVLDIPVQGSPTGVAAGSGFVLVADGPQHSLASVDPAAGSVSYVTRLPGTVSGTIPVAAGAGGVWFADATKRVVGQVDAAVKGGGPAVEIHVPTSARSFLSAYEAFDDMAVGEGAVWVAGDAFGRRVWRLDAVSHRVVASIRLPFVPGSIAAGAGAVWVTSVLDDSVTRIDPATDRAEARIAVPRGVTDVAAGPSGVWVASSIAGIVSRIDPQTNRIVSRVRLTATPTHIAVGAGGVWVTTAKPTPPVSKSTIGIGLLGDCAGAYGGLYDYFVAGASVVLLNHGGRRAGPNPTDGVIGARVAGKPISLELGCADGTTASALAEARRLVEQVGVRVLIGPAYGSEELALQEYARRHPGVAFVNGLAGAQELDPPSNAFSFTPDGAEWMTGLGAYAYRTLGWRRAATVVDVADIGFNWSQAAGFVAEFCSLGGTIVKRVFVPPATEDYSAVVKQIPRHGVDGIVAAKAVLRLPLRHRLARKLVVGAIANNPPLGRLGKRASGVLTGGSFLMLPGAAGRRYLADVKKAFPGLRGTGTGFDIYYHDAMLATVEALRAVHGDLSRREQRFMAALAHVRLDSPTGSVRLDASHQAVAPNYLRRLDGTLIRSIPAVEHTFGGYFTARDRPPGKTTPVCRRGNPPSWAR